MDSHAQLTFLQANVGRGHPFYLDGIIDRLRNYEGSASLEVCDADKISRGISRVAWNGVRWFYERGSSGGMFGAAYARLRAGADYRKQQFGLALLGRDIRRRFSHTSNTLVVSHPVLVAILAGRPNLVYQHGELVVPEESRVIGASTVLVPTDQAATHFLRAGYLPRQIKVTGLCIEPDLAATAEEAYRLRIGRLGSAGDSCGLFLSSGAEPLQHIRVIISSITSCLRTGVAVNVLARRGGRLDREVQTACLAERIEMASYAGPAQRGGVCSLACYGSREEEVKLSATLVPRADFFVGPPHERTNWAVGLGLPMFALTPSIGPFAPLNLSLLVSSGTVAVIRSNQDALGLGEAVARLRASGQLARMAECGWGKYRIDGFDQIARFIVSAG